MKKYAVLAILCSAFVHFSWAQVAQWTSVGPVVFPQNVSGQINGIGRITQIKFHPTDSEIIYATSASGGLFRSDDFGDHWQVLGTDSMPHCQLASVCIDHSNDQTIYLGTGDPNYYSTSFGIWKSTDGGINFEQLAGVGNRMAVEIIMQPTDHNTIVAATNDGIFKTYDAGLTWFEIMNSGAFTDMKLKPGSDSVVYAVTRSAFFRSTDFGSTWTEITNGISVPGGGDGGGMRLAVSAADPNVVYAGMIKDEGTIFRSNDAGLSFTMVYHNPQQSLTGYDENGGGQGNYNFGMVADPTNEDVLYTVSHVVWKSTDGGVSWAKLTDWWLIVHTDMHGMEFSPYYPDKMFNINDGGIWLSEDGGANWSIKSDGLEATEAVHGSASLTQPDIISIGTQDNGELYHRGNSWFTNRGGDWYEKMSFDYTPNGFVYYHGENTRRNPVFGGTQSIALPANQVSDNVKFAFNSTHPDLAFAGLTEVYRTQNLSEATPQWDSIFGEGFQVKDLEIYQRDANIMAALMLNAKIYKTMNALAAQPEFTAIDLPVSPGSVADLALDAHNHEVMYAALGNKVYRTTNNGSSWENITGTLPTVNVVKLEMDSARTDESVYLATAIGVYYRNKNMSDWIRFNEGLPTIANIQDMMIYDDQSIGRRLRVAYYGRGIFETPLYTQNACALPTDVEISVDGIAATVTWAGADSARIQYRNVSDVKWIESGAADGAALLRWLEHCQTYDVRIAAQCATERSFFSIPEQFSVEGKELPSPWVSGDVGNHTFQGYHCFNPATQEIFITSAGDDVWGNADQFYFISQPLDGDGEIIARLTQVERTNGWAKAGLMIRASRNDNATHAMMCMTPDNGAAFQWRSSNAGGSSNTNVEGKGVPYWLKLKKQGDLLTGFISTDGASWEVVESAVIQIGQTAEIGVFSCSHNGALENLVVMDNVSLFPLVTGEAQISNELTVSVYPNPTNGLLMISSDLPIAKLRLTDISGRVLLERNSSADGIEQVDLNSFSAGHYLLEITLSDGSVIQKKVEKV